jgi:hypothetical protein
VRAFGSWGRLVAHAACGGAAALLAGLALSPDSPDDFSTESLAPELVRRLEASGVRPGDVLVALMWDGEGALSLSCREPTGRIVAAESAPEGRVSNGLATLTWSPGRAPAGRYQVLVSGPPGGVSGRPTFYTCAWRAGGDVQQFSGLAPAGTPAPVVSAFTYRIASSRGTSRVVATDAVRGGLLLLGVALPWLVFARWTGWRAGAVVVALTGTAVLAAVLTQLARGMVDWVGAGARVDGLIGVAGWSLLGAALGLALGPPWRRTGLGAGFGLIAGVAVAGLRATGLAPAAALAAGGTVMGLVFGRLDLARASGTAASASASRFRLNVGGRTFTMDDGGRLTARDLPGLRARWPRRAVAAVVRHPADPSTLGMKNLTRAAWSVRLPDGSRREVGPGRAVRLQSGVWIDFGPLQGEIC